MAAHSYECVNNVDMPSDLHKKCRLLLEAYKDGRLGQTKMPEDANPGFSDGDREWCLAYFTLPMALNYQRDSYKLWEAALKTFNDPQTKFLFNAPEAAKSSEEQVRRALMKYKLALQPNKHISTWWTIAKTVTEKWGSFANFLNQAEGDFLKLKQMVTVDNKKGFPYLSGPKIFNYWSFIVSTYSGERLVNRDQIDIAPDTHITQCSVKLGVITTKEAEALTKEMISVRWRDLLVESGINPIDMHPPLWFWSRNGFLFEIS